jgi:hypothetical protein
VAIYRSCNLSAPIIFGLLLPHITLHGLEVGHSYFFLKLPSKVMTTRTITFDFVARLSFMHLPVDRDMQKLLVSVFNVFSSISLF